VVCASVILRERGAREALGKQFAKKNKNKLFLDGVTRWGEGGGGGRAFLAPE
jgi:hypothetical protein